MKLIQSSLKGINNLIGGYDTENIVSIYSQAGVGKTLLFVQEAYNLALQGKKVLYIDTETGVKTFFDVWGKVFSKKYKIKSDNIIVKYVGDIEKLLGLHGVNVQFNISEKKGHKMTVSRVKEKKLEETQIMKTIKKNKIDVIFYDSLTRPFEYFGTNTPNLPARSDAQSYLLDRMGAVRDKGEVSVICSNHASLNPINPFASANMKGGCAIQYFSKVVLYLERFRGKKLSDYRKLWLVRSCNRPAWRDMVLLHYTDDGIVDVSEEDLESIRGEKTVKKDKEVKG